MKLLLLGEIAVGHRANDYPLSPVFLGIFDLQPVFDIQKGTPGLGVSGKALHKGGIAVLTAMGTAHIGVYRVASHG